MDGMGSGYAFEINTLVSPLIVFIGDVAAEAIADQESALDKAMIAELDNYVPLIQQGKGTQQLLGNPVQ